MMRPEFGSVPLVPLHDDPLDTLIAAIAAECAKAEQRSRDAKDTGGLVSCRVLRRLLGEVR